MLLKIECKQQLAELEGVLGKIYLGALKLFGKNFLTLLRKKSQKYLLNPEDNLSGTIEELPSGFIIYLSGDRDILEREERLLKEFLDAEVKTQTKSNRLVQQALNKLKAKALGNSQNFLMNIGLFISYEWVEVSK